MAASIRSNALRWAAFKSCAGADGNVADHERLGSQRDELLPRQRPRGLVGVRDRRLNVRQIVRSGVKRNLRPASSRSALVSLPVGSARGQLDTQFSGMRSQRIAIRLKVFTFHPAPVLQRFQGAARGVVFCA